jgi:cytosine/adenosine deaminase-related metal-dependent hydrolase
MLIIRNVDWIIRLDETRTVVRNGAVVIADGVIRDVGRSEDLDRKYEGRIPPNNIVDGSGTVMLPGFVNTHAHVFEHLSRGLFPDDLSSLSWAYEYFFLSFTENSIRLDCSTADALARGQRDTRGCGPGRESGQREAEVHRATGKRG